MSQERAAAELGVSARWYGNLERNGHDMGLTADVLENIATVLRMGSHDRHALFLLGSGKEPPSGSLNFPSATIVQRLLDTSPYPGYVSDKRWDIKQTNDAWQRVWGSGPVPSNVVLYVLTEHRVRDTVLLDWADGWALPVLRQVRAALLTWPTDEGLKRLQREVETAAAQDQILGALCRKAWEEEYIHASGDTRLLNHAEWGPSEITLLMVRGLDPESGHRIVWILPPESECSDRSLIMTTSLLRGLVDRLVDTGESKQVLVGSDGAPEAVLLPFAEYQRLVKTSGEAERAAGRGSLTGAGDELGHCGDSCRGRRKERDGEGARDTC
ncbi:transcriptional regulator [Kitasatospora aureofaciens]|uniref:MmyB family transcriptional regulator n=1 Tax=Kitasatospora aureofaciens TaxID=1894 RepID=UPI0005262550